LEITPLSLASTRFSYTEGIWSKFFQGFGHFLHCLGKLSSFGGADEPEPDPFFGEAELF
jgi:hypothetical protein